MSLRLGAVADDFTGATDLAGGLASQGARTLLVLGRRPEGEVARLAAGFDVAVIGLKSRSIRAADACTVSVEATQQLVAASAERIYFKYCSTFDSTKAGNIGPVTDALMDELGVDFTLAVPAFPANGRTQYLGHLFVGGALLSESPMRHHPVTPMTDANLVRHLQAQTRRRVGLLDLPAVRSGVVGARGVAAGLRGAGVGIALVDATSDADLDVLAAAFGDARLLTGGSALGARMGARWRAAGIIGNTPVAAWRTGGSVLVLAGSCSARTLEQVADFEVKGHAHVRIDVPALLTGDFALEIDRVVTEAQSALGKDRTVLVSSSMAVAGRGPLLSAAAGVGVDADTARARIEHATATIAKRLVALGVRNLVVAGGETSGAVVEALGVGAMEIGAEIDPGVPRCRALTGPDLNLVLKSGNFGSVDFFEKCLRLLG